MTEQNKKAVLLIAGLVCFALLVIIGINVMFRVTISRYDPGIIFPECQWEERTCPG